LNATIEVLKDEGATVIDNTRIPIEPAYDPEFTALLCEFKTDIAAYLETYTRKKYPKTLQELIDFNNAHPELEGPWNSLIFDLAQATGGRADPACVAAREFATATAQAAIDDLMAAHDLDAIIAPTNGPAWVTDPVNGDLGGDFSTFIGSSSPSAIAGYANITVPAGYVGPLPIGVSFIGGRWDEPTLIGFAYDFEQASKVRVPPRFLKTTSAAPTGAAASPGERRAVVPGRAGSQRLMPLR
jgi:amidase